MNIPPWSASMLHAEPLGLAATAGILKRLGCSELHMDIMDGTFVPHFGFPLQTVASLKAITDFPIDIHLMVQQPEKHIHACIETGCTSITLHVESNPHIHRTIQQVKDAGLQVGIAINPGTPLTKLEYLLPSVDNVHLLLTDFGSRSSHIPQVAFDRIKILRENISYHEYRVQLSAEGPILAKDAVLLAKYGADRIVLDNASIFGPGDLEKGTLQFLEECKAEAPTV